MKMRKIIGFIKKSKKAQKETGVVCQMNLPQYRIFFREGKSYYVTGEDSEARELPRSAGGWYYHPLEDDSEFQKILPEVQRKVDAEVKRIRQEQFGEAKYVMGLCHIEWGIKKQILKEQYGVEWLSVSDLNDICID
ncbi:MAG: hypothetical protein IJZ85_00080 [Lachnospiraceae bacterium]|nr:hypothetical protein [Lachnospiraceae bacterium]